MPTGFRLITLDCPSIMGMNGDEHLKKLQLHSLGFAENATKTLNPSVLLDNRKKFRSGFGNSKSRW
jgi:hypothetical protein